MIMSRPALIGLFDVVFVIRRNLVNRRPVGNQKTFEAQFILKHVGEQIFVAVHFLAVPTAVGNHDGTHAGLDGGAIWRQIKFPQSGFVANGVALVIAVFRAAIANEMFRAGQNRTGSAESFRPEIHEPPPRPVETPDPASSPKLS